MKKEKLLFTLVLFFIFFNTKAQYRKYANHVVDTLASPYFAGRSNADSGEYKASKFIVKQYEDFGIKPVGKTYRQYFHFSLNTFPGKTLLIADDDTLRPGYDFLVKVNSDKLYGTFSAIRYDTKNLPGQKDLNRLSHHHFFDDKVVIVDTLNATKKQQSRFKDLLFNVYGAAAIIQIKHKKLIWDKSLKATFYPEFKVKSGVLPAKIEKITIRLDEDLLPDYRSQNVIAMIKGSEKPDSVIVFSAHYDHLGMMGKKAMFSGANDNASGTSMVLALANYFSTHPPKYSIAFMDFGAEECGLLGSHYYTQHPLFALNKIKLLINLDMVGTGDGGIMMVNAKKNMSVYNHFVALNDSLHFYKILKKRGPAANSDHYFFDKKGVPAVFIYTMGKRKSYHDVFDVAATLPMNYFNQLFDLLKVFVASEG